MQKVPVASKSSEQEGLRVSQLGVCREAGRNGLSTGQATAEGLGDRAHLDWTSQAYCSHRSFRGEGLHQMALLPLTEVSPTSC